MWFLFMRCSTMDQSQYHSNGLENVFIYLGKTDQNFKKQKKDLTWSKSHFDLDESFITVSKQILGLPVVNSHHPKEQVA